MTETAESATAIPLEKFVGDHIRELMSAPEVSYEQIAEVAVSAVRAHDALTGQMVVPESVLTALLVIARETETLGRGAGRVLARLDAAFGTEPDNACASAGGCSSCSRTQ